MTDSTLSLTFQDLYTEVAYYLGYGRDSAKWDAVRTAAVKRYANDGYRHFLMGPDPRTRTAYEWSFLSPQATLTLWAGASGTMAVSGAGNTTVTDAANAPFHPAMVGHQMVSTNASYTVTTYTSSSVVTVDADASADDGEAFTLSADGRYSLPADFGALVGGPAFGPDQAGTFLLERTSAELRRLLAAGGDSTGTPDRFALQPRTFDASAGQRWELLVWRIPASDVTTYYRYRVHPAEMTADGDLPAGGLPHAQSILQCAIAAAELRERDGEQHQQARRDELLGASIDLDARLKARLHAGPSGGVPIHRGRDGVSYGG